MTNTLRLAVIYLRLWKVCDQILARAGSGNSFHWFDAMPLSPSAEAKMLEELRLVAEKAGELALVPDGKHDELRLDIRQILELCTRGIHSKDDFVTVAGLQDRFQKRAFLYTENPLGVGASKAIAARA